MRVLPPPGTLIWRFPGFIRPRCTAGATHRIVQTYYGVGVHGPKLSRSGRSVKWVREVY